MSLYVSLAAAAASILIQPEKKGVQSNWKPDFSIASDRVFLLGIVTGVGISALINTVSRRYRIMDRARVRFVSLLFVEEEDGDHADLNPEVAGLIVRPSDLRKAPAQALNVKAIRMGETGAELRRLVSPNSMPTSTLHAALITLHSREKMTPCKSLGVEVYYVISGSGVISKPDEEIEFHMSPGDTIAIDPYTTRYVSNTGWDNLLFLRVSDGGSKCSQKGYDAISTGNEGASSTVEMLSAGFQTFSSALGSSALRTSSALGGSFRRSDKAT